MRRRCVAAVGFACALGVLTITSTSASASPRDDLNAALAAKASGSPPTKVRDALEPIAKGPRLTDDDRDIAARASFALGQLHEEGFVYARAMEHYRDVLAIDPGNYYAAEAKARLDALAKYQDAFPLLKMLEGVRQNPARVNDPVSIGWIYGVAATWPPSRTKDEAYVFASTAWAYRLSQPASAIEPALTVARREGADPTLRANAWTIAYDALEKTGDVARVQKEIGDDPRAPEDLRTRVRRDARRRWMERDSRIVGKVGVAAFVVSAIAAIARGRASAMLRAWRSPHALAAIVIGAIAAYFVCERWEGGQGVHFLYFGAAMLAVHLLVGAIRGAIGDRGVVLRAIGAIVAASCVLASAYAALERSEQHGVAVLTGIGL